MKVIVVDPNLIPHRERLEAALPDAEVRWQTNGVSPDELRDADVYVGSRFTAAMADAAEKLKLIHIAGAGTDKVDFDALPPDTLVANTFHHEQSIAEYIVAASVMLRRDFLAQDRQLRHNIWATSVYDQAIPQPSALADARIGFVGFGHIGQRAWNLFRAFGSTGAAVTGSGRVPDVGLAWAADTGELDRLLRECDVAVVSAPLNEKTEGMISERPTAGTRERRGTCQRRPRQARAGARAVRRACRWRHPGGGDRRLVPLSGGRRYEPAGRSAVR